tara:strand:- start:34 stop:633 length:600 start_codon:yes stop_codon:yes gene_type:complete
MKKIIPVIVFLVTLIACQNNTCENDKGPKVHQLEKKIKQLSAEKVIQQQEKITIKEETNDAKISQIEKLKATYNHIRAKFIGTDEGDLFYYNFKDEKGIDYSFSYVKDESYELLIDDTSSNFGLGINTKYKNKYFDIFYQVEKHDLLRWGIKQDYDVVIKMMLVEEITEEMPRKFEIEIIDTLSKKTDKELDKAVKSVQ